MATNITHLDFNHTHRSLYYTECSLAVLSLTVINLLIYTGNLYHTSEERVVGSISTHETEDLFQIKTFLHVKSKLKFG